VPPPGARISDGAFDEGGGAVRVKEASHRLRCRREARLYYSLLQSYIASYLQRGEFYFPRSRRRYALMSPQLAPRPPARSPIEEVVRNSSC
jgi:hypothetical protein